MCSRNGSLRLGSAKNVRGTRHGGMSRSRLVGGISIGGPLRPTPPSSPPSPPPPLCARFYNFLAGHKAARSPNGGGLSATPLRPAWFIREPRVEWEGSVRTLLPLSPSPPFGQNRRPKFSHSPRLSRSWIEARGGHTRAALSLPIGRDTYREKDKGGVCLTDSSPCLFSCPLFHFKLQTRGSVRMSICSSLSVCP